ncbi:hypothetical protein [Tessaracoccus sp.]
MNRHENPDTLAPGVEVPWRDAFVLELRMQGASGGAIADALVEVETHCSESGQSASEAFGPAVEYAKALGLPDESRWTRAQAVRTGMQLLLVVGGFWLAVEGGIAMALGQEAVINLASVVSAGVSLIVMALMGIFSERVLRFVVDHAVLSWMAFMVAVAATVAAGLPFRGVALASMPAAWMLAAGIAAIVVFGVYTLLLRRSGKGLDDPLVPPTIAQVWSSQS